MKPRKRALCANARVQLAVQLAWFQVKVDALDAAIRGLSMRAKAEKRRTGRVSPATVRATDDAERQLKAICSELGALGAALGARPKKGSNWLAGAGWAS